MRILLIEDHQPLRESIAQECGHVFERFWRGDEARSEAALHCGLGLSIVWRIVEVLGGAVTVRSCRGGDFAIAITLPTNGHPTGGSA